MVYPIILTIIIIWLLILRWQRNDMLKLSKQLKNNYRALPIIGHAYMFVGNDEDRMKIFQKLGVEAYATDGLLAIWQGNRLYINISDPVIADLVLKTCLEKDDVMKCSRVLTGNGSVFAPVRIWRPRRKILAPTFSPKNLSQFSQIFTRQSALMVEQLKKEAGKGTFSIWKYITSYSMDSVCESTLGVKIDAQKDPDQPFLKAFEELCAIDAARFCQPWLHSDLVFKMMPSYVTHTKCRKIICGLVEKIIKEKRKSMEDQERINSSEDASKTKSFLELLLESSRSGGGYTELELREEIVVLVLAGTDTTAVGTSFTLLLLAQHQNVQEKLYKEIQDVFGDSDRPISVSDLNRLKYLDAVVRESLRLYPPAPVIVRKVLEDLPLPCGITLVKNCGLVINIWAINRNPKYWGDDSMSFKPERFLETGLKHPAAFIPFSYGPRMCLGYQYAMMSMKTALTTLIRTYKLLPATPADKQESIRVKFDVMMKSVDNFCIKIEERKKSFT